MTFNPSLLSCLLFALSAFAQVSISPAPASQDSSRPADSMQGHYAAARSFLLGGDQQHAALEYDAFLAEALHRVANARAHAGELLHAAESCAEALRFAPQDVSLLADCASVRFDQSQLSEAESLLNFALQLDPVNPRVRFLLGRVLFDQDKYLAAKPHLDSAFASGRRENVWYLLAVTDLKLQQLTAARQLFSSLLGVFGEGARTHFRFGLAYYYGDYPDEAIAEFKKAIARDAAAPDQHYYLGLAYLGNNPPAGFSSAEPEFRAELALDPSDFRSHFMLGYVALKQRNLPLADQELSRAITLKPEDVNTLILFSELQIEMNAEARAEELLRKAIALSKDSPIPSYEIVRAHYLLGRILLRTGRKEDGTHELQVSERLRLRLRPNSGATLEERTFADPLRSDRGQQDPPLSVSASPEERAKADDFVRRLSPLIADAYNNLGAIAADRNDFCASLSSFRKASAWDPSLEGLDRNLRRASSLCGQNDQARPLNLKLQGHAVPAGLPVVP